MAEKKLRFETLQIHGGLQPDDPTGARGVAIYPTAAYRFKSCEHAANLFDLSEGGNIYTRLQNPTTTVYEQRIAALYGAVGALAVSSGMSAILIAVLSLAAEGDNIGRLRRSSTAAPSPSSAFRCAGSASTAASPEANAPRTSRR